MRALAALGAFPNHARRAPFIHQSETNMKTATKPNGKFFTAPTFNYEQKARVAAQSRLIGAYLRARGNMANLSDKDRALFGSATTAQLQAAINGAVIG